MFQLAFLGKNQAAIDNGQYRPKQPDESWLFEDSVAITRHDLGVRGELESSLSLTSLKFLLTQRSLSVIVCLIRRFSFTKANGIAGLTSLAMFFL
jgi:hypothetical protein